MITSFLLANTPRLYFGTGKFSELPSLVSTFGRNALLITGKKSFTATSHADYFAEQCQRHNILLHHAVVEQEPTPAMVDEIVNRYVDRKISVVVAIGGGSVVDAGKAIAAMLTVGEPVLNYLEGVGTQVHPGTKIPFIAIPTTAGTGSEATKNAVLSEIGDEGFKKSLRHNNFVPDIALIDPVLTLTCPAGITASSGMDAFTQLLESLLSTQANAITDALALEGLRQVSESLEHVFKNGSDLKAREAMSLAAFLSGVTLANAGLGTVHGFASSVGGFYDIAHGVVCSAMMYPCNAITVRKLRKEASHDDVLKKYAAAGKLFTPVKGKSDAYYTDGLLEQIKDWTIAFEIPSLSAFNVQQKDAEKIIALTDNKNNPVKLTREELTEALTMAIG